MPRVIYNAPHLDPEMDGLEWTLDRGELISPELTEAQADRYLTIPGFRAVELPKPAEPVNKAEPEPAAAPAPPPPAEPPTQNEAPPALPPAEPPAADAPKPRGKPKPATDAGTTAGDTQKE